MSAILSMGRRKAELIETDSTGRKRGYSSDDSCRRWSEDLPMLSTAGLGIAYHAKPKVKENASQSISTIGLDGVLYFIGFKDSFISEAN